MKKIYMPLIPFLFLILCSGKISAQFIFADYPEQAISPVGPLTVANTGNDIFDFGGSTYEVSVWDDSGNMNAGLGWQKGTAAGYVPFAQPFVTDPDVCIAKDGGNTVYALVVYYVGNGIDTYILEVFKWNTLTSNFNSMSIHNLSAPGTPFGTTLNIDADDGGGFAIVWDNPSQAISIVTGYAATPVNLYLGGTALPLTAGKNPDVSIFYFGAGNNVAQVAYINTAGRVVVDNYRMVDLAAGVLQPASVLISPPPILMYHYPRIASSNFGLGLFNDWTVVVEDNDGSGTYYIVGFNQHVSALNVVTDSYYIYNDGGTGYSPYNTSDVPNLRPVVTYDMDNAPWIGWNIDNSSGFIASPGALLADFPVSLVCDKWAGILPGHPYMYVPAGIQNGQVVQGLSMSGRRSNNCLYTFYSNPASAVLSKSVDHLPAPIHLRTIPSGNISAWLSRSLQNEEGSRLYLFTLHDLTGREVVTLKGTADELLVKLQNQNSKPLKGVYLARIISDDHNTVYNGKLFLGK